MGALYNRAWDYEEIERYVPYEPLSHINTIDELIMAMSDSSVNKYRCRISDGLPFAGCFVFTNGVHCFMYEHDYSDGVDVLKDVFLKTPRVPKYILHEIISYFREDLSNEACCRIEYDHVSKEFSVNYPLEAEVSKVHVKNAIFENDPNKSVVAFFHSHNTMEGKFSRTDNASDREECGIMGVIGNLDKDDFTMSIRGACEGSLMNLPAQFLFSF